MFFIYTCTVCDWATWNEKPDFSRKPSVRFSTIYMNYGVEKMIRVAGLTRAYGDFLAVDDVSFQIGRGEIVGLLGHNGAGKTTIMKMMTGFLEPTEGTVMVDSLDVATSRREVQQKIGYLPENCPLYPEMNVAEYLDYAAGLHNVPIQDRPDAIKRAIHRTGLADKAMQQIGTLSRGYRQRTGVAQAILHSPDIIILDEPTNGLDPNQILLMRELIKELAISSTVIISTHILQEVQAVCDRAIILKSGKKVLDSRLEELQAGAKLVLSVGGVGDPQSLLAEVPGVEGIEQWAKTDDDIIDFIVTVRMADDANRNKSAARVAKALQSAGFELFEMSYEKRNLETVFAEISGSIGGKQ